MKVATANLARLVRETNMTIKVSGARQLALRLRLSALLFRFAARVAGPRSEVSVEYVTAQSGVAS